jgi:hypothetical protein
MMADRVNLQCESDFGWPSIRTRQVGALFPNQLAEKLTNQSTSNG